MCVCVCACACVRACLRGGWVLCHFNHFKQPLSLKKNMNRKREEEEEKEEEEEERVAKFMSISSWISYVLSTAPGHLQDEFISNIPKAHCNLIS